MERDMTAARALADEALASTDYVARVLGEHLRNVCRAFSTSENSAIDHESAATSDRKNMLQAAEQIAVLAAELKRLRAVGRLRAP